ncbi:MAG: TIGR00725 family protein [Nitrospinota bacterium]
MNRTKNIAVVGAGGGSAVDSLIIETAYEVGREIASMNWTLICGGLGGVMEAASRGASENGGVAIGILPGYDHSDGNPYLNFVIPTGLGHARNAVIAAASEGMVALGGRHGTISEVALALKMGKPVAAILFPAAVEGVISVSTAREAITALKNRLA